MNVEGQELTQSLTIQKDTIAQFPTPCSPPQQTSIPNMGSEELSQEPPSGENIFYGYYPNQVYYPPYMMVNFWICRARESTGAKATMAILATICSPIRSLFLLAKLISGNRTVPWKSMKTKDTRAGLSSSTKPKTMDLLSWMPMKAIFLSTATTSRKQA